MSALPLRRLLLLTVPLALVLAGCNLGQGKSVAAPNVDEANPAVGEAPQAVEPIITAVPNCTTEQLAAITPCKGREAGSECTPTDYDIVGPSLSDWGWGYRVAAPEFRWSYPCTPLHFYAMLLTQEGQELSYTTDATTDAGSGVAHSWSPKIALDSMSTHYWYRIHLCATDACAEYAEGATSFWTGPLCWGNLLPPPLLYDPPDGASVETQEQSMKDYGALSWKYPTLNFPCLVKYEGQVSTDKTFTTGVMPIVSTAPIEASGVVGGTVEWCKTYYWRVRANGSTYTTAWSETYSFKIAPPEGWNTCLKMTFQALATKNASCRHGPSTFYAISAYVPAGERHPVEGRNAAGTWVKLQDLKCYIYRELVTLEQQGTPFPGGADVSDLISVLPDPPLPTVAPTKGPSGPVCSRGLVGTACTDAGGIWHPPGMAGGWCDCP